MKIYKYYSANGNNISSLINRQFWASKPSLFNDPYDTPVKWLKYSPGEKIYMTKSTREGSSAKSARRVPMEPVSYSEEEQSKIENMGIICFSLEVDNMLLWSHYTDQHQGFALEFDILDDEIDKGMFTPLLKVVYDWDEIKIRTMSRIIDAARYKNPVWKYENEVRLVVGEGNKLYCWDYLHKGCFKNLTGIIFGNRMNGSIEDALIKICESFEPNILIKKANLSDQAFKLDISPYKKKKKRTKNKKS